jgi:predicted Zn-dependent protease
VLADETFHVVEKAAPESPWWFALVADERVRRRQFHSAFFFYKEAEKVAPNMPDLHNSIAQVYQLTDHSDWAAAERKKEPNPNCAATPQACDFIGGRYEQVLKRGGDSLEARYWQSRAFAKLAANAFDQLERMPEGPEIHELRAELMSARRQNMESVGEWRKALSYAPSDEHLREELLSSLYGARMYPEALKLADNLLRENPSSAELNFTKGDILLNSQQPEQAIPYFEKALKLNPNLLAAHYAIGRAYMALGHQSEAIPHLEKALAMDNDGALRYQLARAFQATGQPELAKKTLQESQQRQKADQEEKSKLLDEMKITPP